MMSTLRRYPFVGVSKRERATLVLLEHDAGPCGVDHSTRRAIQPHQSKGRCRCLDDTKVVVDMWLLLFSVYFEGTTSSMKSMRGVLGVFRQILTLLVGGVSVCMKARTHASSGCGRSI